MMPSSGQALLLLFLAMNALLVFVLVWTRMLARPSRNVMRMTRRIESFLLYQALVVASLVMLVPFYWMVVSSFKDRETANAFPPVWTPSRVQNVAIDPETGEQVPVRLLGVQREEGQLVPAVPEDQMEFRSVRDGEYSVTREVPKEGAQTLMVDPSQLESSLVTRLDGRNFIRAWYAPEMATRGAVNFGNAFWVSIYTGVLVTAATLFTSALAAFAFAKMAFAGKGLFFYIVILTMMIPGQVLLIPNFLTLSALGWLDTSLALIAPFTASVFTIFLMRQFFMTIPDDLWDAAQIDGSGRFRFLWQIVAPLSKPVFVTAGIFLFLGNWNALLWPLIATSSPEMRTLMVALQTFNEESGQEFELLMAAATMAVLPIITLFFLLQRFFIAGIARTGLK
jgi:ABC-type glycerol-3-phosphate transport system permease component